MKRIKRPAQSWHGSSVAGLVGLVVTVVGYAAGVVSALALGVVIGVAVVVAVVVAAGAGIWLKMRLRSMRYHAFMCSSIVDVSVPIKNAMSVFLFFAPTLIINADHRVSDFSSLLAALLLTSMMHCSIEACSR